MKMLKLDQYPKVSQDVWDSSFDTINQQNVSIEKEDWAKVGGNPSLFTKICGSNDPHAIITKSSWHNAFANVGKAQVEAQRLLRSLSLEVKKLVLKNKSIL